MGMVPSYERLEGGCQGSYGFRKTQSKQPDPCHGAEEIRPHGGMESSILFPMGSVGQGMNVGGMCLG